MGTFTPELTFGEYSYGTMTEDPGISYKTLIYGSFSPLSLFAASEPGLWYDFGDLSTLFQDAAGTTPVTAAGQSVGLVLDKSKGLVLGAELVTNGGFDTDIAGWTAANLGTGAAAAWSSNYAGSAALPRVDASNNARIYQNHATVAGRAYKVTFDVKTADGVIIGIGTTNAGTDTLAATTVNGSQTASVIFVATGATSSLSFHGRVDGATTYIDNISVRELPGNHATQSTSLSRPTYQVDSNGRGHLLFDGSDDFLVTPTITPGTDKAQVFAGVRKLSDAGQAAVLALGNITQSGGLEMFAPTEAGGASLNFSANGGVTFVQAPATDYAAPVTAVATGTVNFALATGEVVTRINGSVGATSTGDAGTANLRSDALYIGRRGGTSIPFNGRIYSLICRFGSNLTVNQIAQTEAWVNSKTGAY